MQLFNLDGGNRRVVANANNSSKITLIRPLIEHFGRMITHVQRAQLTSLSRRHRDCLRLVPLRTTDQIALELRLKPNTVEGYIKEARARLGGVTRDAAAKMFIEWEAEPPQNMGGQSSGLAADADSLAHTLLQPEEGDHGRHRHLREDRVVPERLIDEAPRRGLFDRWRQPGDYTPVERVMLVGAMLLVMAIGFPLLILGVVGLVALAGSLRP